MFYLFFFEKDENTTKGGVQKRNRHESVSFNFFSAHPLLLFRVVYCLLRMLCAQTSQRIHHPPYLLSALRVGSHSSCGMPLCAARTPRGDR